jgi:hypothetical protein
MRPAFSLYFLVFTVIYAATRFAAFFSMFRPILAFSGCVMQTIANKSHPTCSFMVTASCSFSSCLLIDFFYGCVGDLPPVVVPLTSISIMKQVHVPTFEKILDLVGDIQGNCAVS